MGEQIKVIWLRSLLTTYFGFNYIYAGIIIVLYLGGIYWLAKASKLKHGRISSKRDILWALIAGVYIGVLVFATLLNREVGQGVQMELMPFWSYRQFILEGNMHLFAQMIYNVLAFVPWPILFVQVFKSLRNFRWAVGSAFLFSVFIEITQLVLKIGLFEFDDMFHNTFGAVIGYGVLTLYRRQKQKGVDE